MKEFEVATEEDLDLFDDQDAYFKYADDYIVRVKSTGEYLIPVYWFKENGDMDGFMGWNNG